MELSWKWEYVKLYFCRSSYLATDPPPPFQQKKNDRRKGFHTTPHDQCFTRRIFIDFLRCPKYVLECRAVAVFPSPSLYHKPPSSSSPSPHHRHQPPSSPPRGTPLLFALSFVYVWEMRERERPK